MATSTVDEGGPVGIKKELREALDAIVSSGTFASQGRLPHVDPQIKVQDVGAISLPLQESQLRQMMKQAHQAPYGKGSETLVDTAVRNTLELNPGQFELSNPNWDNYIKRACTCVARDLGVDSPVSAELYKMLIYEKGAMFKPHTDTEKAPGMFATLVIGLPSPFEGGEVAVKHQGKKMVLTTLQHGFSYVSWYSDVVHEILAVRSGYRWVLTYNLCIDPSRPCPTACLHTDEARHLHRILKTWLNQNTAERELSHAYYRLDHEYTKANISLNALKGRDLASVHLLKEISNDLNMEIFLAVIAKGQMGPCRYEEPYSRKSYRSSRSYFNIYLENHNAGYRGRSGAIHALEQIINTSYEVDTLVGLDGCEVMESMPLKNDNVLQMKCFDVDPQEDYMGYQGNFGPDATHWYRVAAVVIVPRDSIAHFLKVPTERSGPYTESTCQGNKALMIGYLAKSLAHTPDDQFLIKTLKDLCQEVWTMSETGPPGSSRPPRVVLPEAVITKVLQAAIISKDPDFVKDAVGRLERNLSPDFFTWVQEQTAVGLITFDTIKDIGSIVGILSRTICSHAPAMEASDFHSLWLPFLHHLVRFCEANSIPTSTPDYQRIFAAILKAYINNYVGERPSHDGNYVRPTVGHGCADCISLNRFLSDPAQTVGRFSVNQKRRHHLHLRLDAAKIDCTHETERIGSPQTLVVTKSFPRHERDSAAWGKRKAEAGVKLLDFNKRDLTGWFGEEYEGLMGMVGHGPSSGRRPAGPVPNRPTRPRKRKAADIDVVDLRDD